MPRRFRHLEMATDLVEVPARRQQLVALGERKDDLIRRLLLVHGLVLLPALTGITVAQHLDHYGASASAGLSPCSLGKTAPIKSAEPSASPLRYSSTHRAPARPFHRPETSG